MTTAKRSPLPPLVVRAPDCPICYREVGFDADFFWCESCHGTWASDAYDEEGEANPDVEQCPAEVMPYRDREDLKNIRGYRFRCVRDIGHHADGPFERHIGTRSDGAPDYDGVPFEWRDGDHPQWQPTEEAAADA